MPLMEWSDQLSTRIPSIDRQHKVILGYINDLHDGIEKGEIKGILDIVMQGLVNYTRTHFAYEEMLFKRYGYEDQVEHLKTHERMVVKISDFKDRYTHGAKDIGPELLEFLKDWLTHHILEDDMAYSEHLIAQGVE